jgi:hypothetical protein
VNRSVSESVNYIQVIDQYIGQRVSQCVSVCVLKSIDRSVSEWGSVIKSLRTSHSEEMNISIYACQISRESVAPLGCVCF